MDRAPFASELGGRPLGQLRQSLRFDVYRRASRIAVYDRSATFEDQGTATDATLAIWDAICRLEQRLREVGR